MEDVTFMRLRRRSRLLMMAVIVIVIVAMAVRIFNDVPAVSALHLSMRPISAICFLLATVSFLLMLSPNQVSWKIITTQSLAITTSVVGLIELLLWFYDKGTNDTPTSVFRMALNTSLNFIFLGISISLIAASAEKKKTWANYTTLILLLITLFALIVHLYRVKDFHGVLTFIPMPILAAVCFAFSGLALLFINPDKGFMRIMYSDYAGSTIAKILIPFVVLAPVTLGYIRLFLQWLYPVSVELGVSFLITAIALLFFFLVLYVSFVLNEKDRQRKIAEDELARVNISLERIIEDRTKEILANERRFRTMVENEYNITVLLSEKFETLYRSPAAARVTGWTVEERKNLPIFDITHEEDIQYLRQKMHDIVHGPDKIISVAVRTRHKNGHYIWLEGVYINKIDDPDVRGIIVNLHDVTAQKTLEEQQKLLASIVNSSDDAILSKKLDGTIITWNKGAERLYEYTATEAIGKNVAMLIPENRLDEEPAIIEKIKNGEMVDHFETIRKKKNGDLIDVSLSISPIKDLNGMIIGASKIARNISDRKEAEKEILKLNTELEERVIIRTEQLQAANKEMEAFSYSVSHDLRAPLRILDGYSQILLEDYQSNLDAEGQRIINVISSNAKKMGHLIDDLLNLSKVGKTELRFATINMNDLVKDVIQQLQLGGIAPPEKITLLDLGTIRCDENLIKQVWINLLSNAIKYSGKKSVPEITLGMYESDIERTYFIKDNGAGFDMLYYGKLFGVFQRLHGQQEFSGTGVGLAIVQRIITRHEGKVWAESIPGEGATFFFSLPNKKSC